MRQLLDHEKNEVVKALKHYAKHTKREDGTDLALLALEIELAATVEVRER